MSEEGRRVDPEASGRLLFALSLLAGALLRLILLGSPDLFGFDEGTWAVGARNLVEGGFAQFVGLSNAPLGDPSGTPVLFPMILSLMVRIFGPVEWAIRIPSAAAGLIGAVILERIVRRSYGQPAGHLAGAFAALFPPLVSASRAATVEPTFVALGLAGVIFGLRTFEEDLPGEGVAAGAFFGLAFLAKGYAVALFLGPLLLALLVRPSLLSLGQTKRSLFRLLAAFVVVGGSHLLLVAIAAPASFGFQLASSFGASEAAARAAQLPTAFGADVKTIIRGLFFFLPLAGLGVAYLSRGVSDAEIASGATGGERRLSHGALWAAYGVELLAVVLVAGRLRLSSIPVIPALAALAGIGGAALLSPSASPRRRRIETRAVLASGALVLGAAAILVSAPDDPLFGGRSAPFSAAIALSAIAAAAIGSSLLTSGVARSRLYGRFGLVFLTALLTAGGLEASRAIRNDLLTHRTGARELAEQIAPAVAGHPPNELAYRGVESEAIAFRLFRTGRSWSGVPSAEAVAREKTVACWTFRPGDRLPPLEIRQWLAVNATELTTQVDARAGRKTGLQVFGAR